jgi:hypothetical protein
MAVTLPVIVLIYELLKSSRWVGWNAFLSWIWRDAAPALISGAITAFYVYSKIGGIKSTTGSDAYRPIYSWHNFMTSNASFVGELLYAPRQLLQQSCYFCGRLSSFTRFCAVTVCFGSWPSG